MDTGLLSSPRSPSQQVPASALGYVVAGFLDAPITTQELHRWCVSPCTPMGGTPRATFRITWTISLLAGAWVQLRWVFTRRRLTFLCCPQISCLPDLPR